MSNKTTDAEFSPLFDEDATINAPDNLRSDLMTSLYEKSINCDAIFNVDGREFRAHRAILAAQSPVFDKMLLGGNFKEAINGGAVELPDKNADSFDVFLKYLYTFTVKLGGLRLDTIIDIIHLANEYQVDHLLKGLGDALETVINDENVFQIFECAHLLNLDDGLLDACRDLIFENSTQLIKSVKIYDLQKAALIDLISNDLFFAPEIELLSLVNAWHKKHPDECVKDVLRQIRFPYLTLDSLKFSAAAPLFKLLFDNGFDLETIAKEMSSVSCIPRKKSTRVLTENVATLAQGATVENLSFEQTEFFFESKSYWQGYLPYNSAVVIKLGGVFRIGSLAFDIYGGGDDGNFPCFFKIETSYDKIKWKILANCQNYACNREQLLIFRPRPFQYVKLTAFPVPNNNQNQRHFSIEAFQCPSEVISTEEMSLYAQECPTGKTLLYQRRSKLAKIFD